MVSLEGIKVYLRIFLPEIFSLEVNLIVLKNFLPEVFPLEVDLVEHSNVSGALNASLAKSSRKLRSFITLILKGQTFVRYSLI